jgi:hypothetical protein
MTQAIYAGASLPYQDACRVTASTLLASKGPRCPLYDRRYSVPSFALGLPATTRQGYA